MSRRSSAGAERSAAPCRPAPAGPRRPRRRRVPVAQPSQRPHRPSSRCSWLRQRPGRRRTAGGSPPSGSRRDSPRDAPPARHDLRDPSGDVPSERAPPASPQRQDPAAHHAHAHDRRSGTLRRFQDHHALHVVRHREDARPVRRRKAASQRRFSRRPCHTGGPAASNERHVKGEASRPHTMQRRRRSATTRSNS